VKTPTTAKKYFVIDVWMVIPLNGKHDIYHVMFAYSFRLASVCKVPFLKVFIS